MRIKVTYKIFRTPVCTMYMLYISCHHGRNRFPAFSHVNVLMEVMWPGEGRNSVDQNKRFMSLAKAVCRVPKVLCSCLMVWIFLVRNKVPVRTHTYDQKGIRLMWTKQNSTHTCRHLLIASSYDKHMTTSTPSYSDHLLFWGLTFSGILISCCWVFSKYLYPVLF